MYLFGFGDSCCGILIKWKIDKRITIYHGSEKNIGKRFKRWRLVKLTKLCYTEIIIY